MTMKAEIVLTRPGGQIVAGSFQLSSDGESYEVGLSRPGFQPTASDLALGDQCFSRLRSTVVPLTIVWQ